MADLIAQGPLAEQRWRRHLETGETHVLGRGQTPWSVPWDSLISRQHAEVVLTGNRLSVKRLEGATNPLFFHGKQLNEFFVSAGEHFVIGETKFILTDDRVMVTVDHPQPDAEQMYDPEYLRGIDYRDAGQKIAVLGQLPELISRAGNDLDLMVHLVTILMTGIRRANTIALIQVDIDKFAQAHPSGGAESATPLKEAWVEVVHWDQRKMTGGDFQPSLKLIQRALTAKETVLHLWSSLAHPGPDALTIANEGDWAFVTPLPGGLSEGWAFYVSGTFDRNSETDSSYDGEDLKDDIKFTELIAATFANLRQVRSLERTQSSLRSFFSPVVLDAIADQDPDQILSPRECEVSVLFCDLRGFSLKSEQMSHDLHELLDRVSQALGVTTSEILNERGVVGDFHGDAAMGFWGWPLDQPDRAARACRAALQIQSLFEAFSSQPEHPLHDFRIGLGIASGTAVAGKIGTSDQVKVSVFGPVVNIAARLETMTSQLRAGILIDEPTASILRESDIANEMRVRRLAVVRPVGMEQAISLSQVLPPHGPQSALTDEHLQAYESALDEFTAGRWDSAFEYLHQVPADDQAKDFLTVYIAQHNRSAPSDWPGFVALSRK